MKAILDTHVLLWWANDDRRLSRQARDFITDPGNVCYLSVGSCWEIVLKSQSGKLEYPAGPSAFLEQVMLRQGIELLPVHYRHVRRIPDLPLHHRDPFDRLLIAQSLEEGIPLVSGDKAVRRYPIEVIW